MLSLSINLLTPSVRNRPALLKRRLRQIGSILCMSGLLLAGSQLRTRAAERLIIQVGPVKQSVAIADLEAFAKTGEPPDSLSLYHPLLTPNVQRILSDQLAVNPDLGNKVVKDLLQTRSGVRLIESLGEITPDVSIPELRSALTVAAQRDQKLSLLGMLKALPQETVTIDALAATMFASQINFSYLQSQSMGAVLAQQLYVATDEEESALPSTVDPTQVGPFSTRHRGLLLRDTERDRLIPVELYWSKRYSHGPLIVISHGFGADRKFLTYLAEHLASYGFVVASIEHPGSNVAALTTLFRDTSDGDVPDQSEASRILPATEFIDRPQDVSFVLDHLEWLNQYSHVLKGRLNTNEVSIIGHSMGGYTALVLAGARLSLPELQAFCQNQRSVDLSPADWLQCAATDLNRPRQSLADHRIRQVMLFNPIIGQLFGQHGLQGVRVPTLMLSGTEDPVTPAISQQLWPFEQLHSEKYLITAVRGTHLSVGDPAYLNPALTENPLIRERPGYETDALRQFVRGISLAFIMQKTPQADRYQPFLTAQYAQSFATEGLPLRLNEELPPGLSQWLRVTARPEGGTNTPLRQLASAIHLEALGAWHQVATLQQTILRSQQPTLFPGSTSTAAQLGPHLPWNMLNIDGSKVRAGLDTDGLDVTTFDTDRL
ncbi:MAG: alpha/beta hydrolase [Thainema sp.]